MSTITIVFALFIVVVFLLGIGNFVLSVVAERRNPPVGSFIECDGVRLHYLKRGDAAAPCVVLFHGNGAMIQDFIISGLIDLLARRNHVLCFDRPGFGHSQRPRSRIWTLSAQAALFAKALERMGVRNPVIVGHSWGSLVAIALSLHGDYSVRGLVLASGYYFPDAAAGCVAVVRARHTHSWRPSPLYRRAHNLSRHATRIAPQDFRTTSRATGLQEAVSDFARASSQAVEGGGGGKCVPRPSSRATAIPVLSDQMSSQALSWWPRSFHRVRTDTPPAPRTAPLSAAYRPRRGSHGALCRPGCHYSGY